MNILSDAWIKDVLINYSFMVGLSVAMLKLLAMRHPEVPTDRIIDLLKKVWK